MSAPDPAAPQAGDTDPGAAVSLQVERLADLAAHVGREIGRSPWLRVEQPRIDAFAGATGDHQWIHCDPARAAEGPFGATVAHGFLTLSLLPALLEPVLRIGDARMGVNVGTNRVRFPAPVRSGSEVRAVLALRSFEPVAAPPGYGGGAQLVLQATVQVRGQAKPACVAELVSRWYA